MDQLSPHRINTLLNEYLDGVLDSTDRKLVEDLLASDQKTREEFERVKRMRSLLSDRKKIEPNIAFWTRLSASLHQHETEDSLLPFPRKYFPTAALASVVGVMLIGLVVFQNRMSLLQFVTQKSEIVQSAYEHGILKGTIMPLLSHVDNNQVLEFSLLGVLPLDNESNLALKVDENSANGYQIRLGKTGETKKSKPITVKDFYSEIQATKDQEKVIDSLVGVARQRLEGSVLVSENHAVAIDPELAQLNKVMVSNIAACLEPFQRVRFGRFLERRNAPYTFVSKKFVPADPESIFVAMNRTPGSHKFVVVTADTLTYTQLSEETIRQVQRSAELSERMKGIVRQNLQLTEQLLQRYAAEAPRPEQLPRMETRPLEVWKDADGVGIQFQRDIGEPEWGIRQRVVVPLLRHIRTYTMSSPNTRVEVGFYGDSVTPGEIMVDSAMVRFFDQENSAVYNLRMMDSIFSSLSSRFQMRPGPFAFDSVFRSLQEARQRAFEEGRRHQQLRQEDVRLRKKDPSSNER